MRGIETLVHTDALDGVGVHVGQGIYLGSPTR
jgi:EAL domain-containing protein (putative c-di-GMP-specific phosphodiesterase class I)